MLAINGCRFQSQLNLLRKDSKEMEKSHKWNNIYKATSSNKSLVVGCSDFFFFARVFPAEKMLVSGFKTGSFGVWPVWPA